MNLKKWHLFLLSVVVLIIIILFATPRIARKYIVNNSHELIGRNINIDKIRFNYFTGELRIHELKLYEQDKKSVFIGFNKLLVNLDYWPLFNNELMISEIRLNDFYTNVEQNGDVFNFSDLIESDTTNNESDEPDTISEDSMILSFNNITISNSQTKYTDHLLNHIISLDDIDLFIPGFTLNSASTNLALNFDFAQGGSLNSNMHINQVDSTYAINLKLDSLNLDIIEPYFKNSLDISELKGYFSNDILLQGSIQHIMQIHMKGWNKIESFEMIDPKDRDVLKFDEFRIDIDTLLLQEQEIAINEIALLNPYVLFELSDSTNNWFEMMMPADAVQPDSVEIKNDTTEEQQEFIYSLAKLELQNAEILFRDKTVKDEFEALLHHFNITSQDISKSATNILVDISAELNETAQIKSELQINPQNIDDINIDFSLNKLAMKDIEPYMMHYVGYPVEGGLLSFSTSNDIKPSSFTSENNIYVSNFELGKADKKDAIYKLPLKLALGILSDKDGIIDLHIPVENKNDETSIANTGKLILKTFSNLIVKAASSPVNFLANLYGANPEDLDIIEIGIFDSILKIDQKEKLEFIAKVLEEKSKLSCEFQYFIDREQYYDILAVNLTMMEFNEVKGAKKVSKRSMSSDSLFRYYIIKKLDLQDSAKMDIYDLCSAYIGEETLKARLDSTQKFHHQLINEYFLNHKSIEANRIKITSGKEKSVDLKNENATFNVQFKTLNQ